MLRELIRFLILLHLGNPVLAKPAIPRPPVSETDYEAEDLASILFNRKVKMRFDLVFLS